MPKAFPKEIVERVLNFVHTNPGVPYTEIGKLFGVSASTVSNWIYGHRNKGNLNGRPRMYRLVKARIEKMEGRSERAELARYSRRLTTMATYVQLLADDMADTLKDPDQLDRDRVVEAYNTLRRLSNRMNRSKA